MKSIYSLRSLFCASTTLLAVSSAHAIDYYWDDNAAGANFGTAGASLGTWEGPTTGTVAGWSLSTTGANAFAGFTTLTTDALFFGNGATGLGAGTVNVSGTVASGNMTFASGSGAIVLSGGTINLAAATSIAVNNTTNTISSAITGAGTSLTKAGTGRLILSGTSTTRTGGTSLTGGNLTVVGTSATTSMLGTGAVTWATNGTTLQFQSDSNLSVGNSFGTSGTRNIGRTLVVDRLSGGDASSLTYTFSAQQFIDTGSTLTLSAGSNITSGTPTINFSGGIRSSDSSAGTITLTPNGVNFRVNGFSNTRARTITLAGNSADSEMYGTGIIEDKTQAGRTVNVIKSGTSTWTLSGTSANFYTAGTSITGGTLVFRSIAAKSSSGTHVFNANTTLGLGVATSGAFFTSTDVDNAFAGTMTGNLSNVTVTATTSVGIDTTNADFTYATSVTGSPTKGLTKLGTNVLTLSGTASTYTGATTIRAGTLSVGLASNLSAAAANLVFDGGTLRVTGTALTSLTDLGRTNAVVFNAGRTVGLDIADAGNTFTVGQVLNQSTGGFTKTGAGTAILSQTNTYTGLTAVTAGTLIINGSTSSTSLLSVGVNGTLGGTGTVGGHTTISGTHNPGNSPGIQTFTGNLSYVDAGTPDPTVNWELNGNTSTNLANPNTIFDQVIVGGNLDFTNITTINLIFNGVGSGVLWGDVLWDSSQSWLLYDVAGTTSNFANLNLNAINWLDSGGNLFSTTGGGFSLGQSGQDVVLNYTVIPEPRAALLGSLGVLLLFRRRHR